jgi:hypothetical protein
METSAGPRHAIDCPATESLGFESALDRHRTGARVGGPRYK